MCMKERERDDHTVTSCGSWLSYIRYQLLIEEHGETKKKLWSMTIFSTHTRLLLPYIFTSMLTCWSRGEILCFHNSFCKVYMLNSSTIFLYSSLSSAVSSLSHYLYLYLFLSHTTHHLSVYVMMRKRITRIHWDNKFNFF
jgi:hypothetical protein